MTIHPTPHTNGANGAAPPPNGLSTNGAAPNSVGTNQAVHQTPGKPVEKHAWFNDAQNTQDILKQHHTGLSDLEQVTESSFVTPQVDTEFIKGIADQPDAEETVAVHAGDDFDTSNPLNTEADDREIKKLEKRVDSHEKEEAAILAKTRSNPNNEEIATTEPKVENAHRYSLPYILTAALLAGGIGMMCFTLASFLLEGLRFPFLYTNPEYAVIFVFLPLGMMVLLAQIFVWIEDRSAQKQYLFSLCSLTGLLFVGWLATLGNAHSDSGALDDITVAAPFNWYALNVILQLSAEVVLGSVLKISMQMMDRQWRKTVVYQTATGQAHRADHFEAQTLRSIDDAKLSAIHRYRKSHKAARNKHIKSAMAALSRIQNNLDAKSKAANAAAEAARVAYHLNSNNT